MRTLRHRRRAPLLLTVLALGIFLMPEGDVPKGPVPSTTGVASAAQPVETYTANFVINRKTLRRASRRIAITVHDRSCFADESDDSAKRFAGVRVRVDRYAVLLTARFRENPSWPEFSNCEGTNDPRHVVRTTVTLAKKLGKRGIVDAAPGASDFTFVVIPPVGAAAIRSLAPPHVYSGRDCDAGPVKRAFRGIAKDEWCYY